MSFDGYEGIPPQLPSSVVSVFDDYDVTPPQLPSTVLSVLDRSGPPPKVLMVSETEQLPPLCQMTLKKYIRVFLDIYTIFFIGVIIFDFNFKSYGILKQN